MENDRELIKEIINKEKLKVRSKTTITADVNDGDYYKVVELFAKLKGDWENRGELLSKDEVYLLAGYIPCMYNEEVHTIEDYSYKIYLDGVLYE